MSEELSLHFQFADQDEGYVELPDSLTARMFDVVRAVAKGFGGDATLLVEAQHLKMDIEALLHGVSSGHEV